MEKMAWTAASLGCEAVQVFSRSPKGGKAKTLDPSDVAAARSVLSEKGVWPLVVHVPYFLNLATTDPEKRGYSLDVVVEDLKRTEALGGEFLVTHPGHKNPDEAADSPDVLARALANLEEILARYSGPVKLLLENTAGQGQEIGSSFESVAALVRNLPERRVGTCLDTCHAFAAGYDMRGKAGVRRILTTFDRAVGLKTLGVIHLNDSKGGLGSRIDRHQHIGQGEMGVETFRALVNSPLLPDNIPGLLETPNDRPDDDLRNVRAAKGLKAAYAGEKRKRR